MRSFTAWLSVIVVGMALVTAAILYDKELSSLARMQAGGGEVYSLTASDVAQFRQAAFWYFVIFCLPVIPLLICAGKEGAQMVIVVVCMAIVLIAVSATPGEDRKGCVECLMPIHISILSSILMTVVASLWIVAASMRGDRRSRPEGET